jgi:hypothetical protein
MNGAEVPAPLKTWISDMVTGRTHVRVGHMMFSVDENFQNLIPDHGLYLIRTHEQIVKWIGGDAERAEAIRVYVADEVRRFVYDRFPTSDYPGD